MSSTAQTGRPRYFKNDAEPARRDPYKQVVASLKRLVDDYPPNTLLPGGGIYYGPISIAYLFYALQPLYPDLEVMGEPLGHWSAEYLKQAQAHMKVYPGPTFDKCGVSDDIMCILALDAASTKDADMAAELCRYAAVTADEQAGDEWLYGRAGYLYLLRMVKQTFARDAGVAELIEETADEVIEAIMESSRPWKWHGKAYVGAVHGAVGIITQIVLTDPSWAPKLEGDLAA
ncbi:MAG: hypothetical protein INR71_04650, partial [Terriglobus roseus]|nr:hypothetical protein [Terriglobus roseus]